MGSTEGIRTSLEVRNVRRSDSKLMARRGDWLSFGGAPAFSSMLLTGWTFPSRLYSKNFRSFTLRNQTSDRFDRSEHLVTSKHVVLDRISQNAFLRLFKGRIEWVSLKEGGMSSI